MKLYRLQRTTDQAGIMQATVIYGLMMTTKDLYSPWSDRNRDVSRDTFREGKGVFWFTKAGWDRVGKRIAKRLFRDFTEYELVTTTLSEEHTYKDRYQVVQ